MAPPAKGFYVCAPRGPLSHQLSMYTTFMIKKTTENVRTVWTSVMWLLKHEFQTFDWQALPQGDVWSFHFKHKNHT